jgi:hypothetical protein
MLPVLGVVVVLTAVGGLVVHSMYQQPAPAAAPAMQIVLPSVSPSTSAGNTPEPGDPTVKLTSNAALYPLSGQVQRLLQNYFDAINARQYDDWVDTVVPARVKENPRSSWELNYSTTRDGTITIYRIDEAPQDGLRVLLSFTSTQALAHAPQGFPHTCIRWQVIWALAQSGGQWRLDTGPSGKTPQREAC